MPAAFARQVAPAAANPPIDLATHTVRSAPDPSGLVVDEQTARAFVATSEDVTVLGAAAGAILAVVTAPAATRRPGFAPSIALDARRARVFVGRGSIRGALAREVRARWPGMPVIVRADSGCGVPALYVFCERAGIGYTLRLIPNPRLEWAAAPLRPGPAAAPVSPANVAVGARTRHCGGYPAPLPRR